MVEELCADVRRIIMERTSAMEDMCLVVMTAMSHGILYSRENCRVLFYVSRNMRDPPHHVRFHVCGDLEPTHEARTYLLRNPKALRQMIHDCIRGNIVMSFYLQGTSRPTSYELNWDKRFDDFDPEHKEYVNSRVLVHHCYADRDRVREEVYQRVIALVSEN